MMGWTKFEENQGKRVGETEMSSAWINEFSLKGCREELVKDEAGARP